LTLLAGGWFPCRLIGSVHGQIQYQRLGEFVGCGPCNAVFDQSPLERVGELGSFVKVQVRGTHSVIGPREDFPERFDQRLRLRFAALQRIRSRRGRQLVSQRNAKFDSLTCVQPVENH